MHTFMYATPNFITKALCLIIQVQLLLMLANAGYIGDHSLKCKETELESSQNKMVKQKVER